MINAVRLTFPFVLLLALTACRSSGPVHSKGKRLHRSEQLIVTRISENAFIHTSYHQTNDFGNVPCNGLIVRDGAEVVIFDTPTKDAASEELISWIEQELHCRVKAVVPTHFHVDCLGGLGAFHAHGIPSHAHAKTIELAAADRVAVPQQAFTDTLVLLVGSERVVVRHFGEGHTVDNVVGYFAKEDVLFGGCLIKEIDASKGYLGDANVDAWSGTVERVKQAYPQVKVVVPGHGRHGDGRLLDYTIALFKLP
ncbi:MAG: subclass B1 metallo-beta-lactamase [Flavobacteriales bacterium]